MSKAVSSCSNGQTWRWGQGHRTIPQVLPLRRHIGYPILLLKVVGAVCCMKVIPADTTQAWVKALSESLSSKVFMVLWLNSYSWKVPTFTLQHNRPITAWREHACCIVGLLVSKKNSQTQPLSSIGKVKGWGVSDLKSNTSVEACWHSAANSQKDSAAFVAAKLCT